MVQSGSLGDGDGDVFVFGMDGSLHGSAGSNREKSVVPGDLMERLERLSLLIVQQTDFERKLLEEVQRSKLPYGVSCARDCALLAQRLEMKGYSIRAHGPGTDNPCQKKGRICLETISHSYLTCSGRRGADGSAAFLCKEDLIVEPYFKEEFQIAYPTQSYKAVLSVLPEEFIGPANKLAAIISAVSQATAQAFTDRNIALPPWRRTVAALSKWGLEPPEGSAHCNQPTEKGNPSNDHSPQIPAAQASEKPMLKTMAWMPNVDSSAVKCTASMKANRVSLLARGIADMAAKKRRQNAVLKKDKIKRTFSWDFSGVPSKPTTRVHRIKEIQAKV